MKSKRGSTQGPILVCASEEVPESIDEVRFVIVVAWVSYFWLAKLICTAWV